MDEKSKDMSRDPLVKRKTALSYKTREKTVMRGYNLSDLAEEGYSFSDAMFVLFQGRIPTEAEEKMLTYEMGSFLEHSMSPSAGSAIAVTAGRPNLPTAVAAGVMTFGGVHGPGAAHGYMMNKYLERGQAAGTSILAFGHAYAAFSAFGNMVLEKRQQAEASGQSVEEAARELVGGAPRRSRARDLGPLPGGPGRETDARAAKELGVAGPYIAFLEAMAEAAKDLSDTPVDVDLLGAMAAPT